MKTRTSPARYVAVCQAFSTILLVLLFITVPLTDVWGQRHVSQEVMADIYEQVKTPYKYGMVVAPTDNKHKIDCPTVFREGDNWYMTYVIYNGQGGQDGRGYETWLAESPDLLHWTTLGRVLSYRDGYWDENQRGGFPSLIDMEWGGSYALQRYKGRAYMTYLGGPGTGYEAVNAPLEVGLAWTKESPATAHEWEALDTPLLSINDPDVQWWEKLVQYKSMVYWDKQKTLGAPFVMYYNAGGINPETNFKGERIGIALSKDMRHWTRYEGNPVMSHESQGTITGDAQLQKIGDVYVMFYFSAWNPARPYKAFNTFACSYDLLTWDDWEGDDLIYPTKDYDEMFAHKSFVLQHEGVVYHFYCAVNNDGQRGIALATSRHMGQSEVHFPARPAGGKRTAISLNEGWKTWLVDGGQTGGQTAGNAAESGTTPPADAITVNIPHNWDDYHGYRQLTHGNLHGSAIYQKTFDLGERKDGSRYFLRLEGVGTYATVSLNGHDLGRHPVGRTCLTLDVTDALAYGAGNLLEIRADHPEMIADMPWVCGGCSSEWGFSEGSQPFGLFRPVTLEVTSEVRVEPFGVHIWNGPAADTLYIETEVHNYSAQEQTVQIRSRLHNEDGGQVFRLDDPVTLAPGETRIVRQQSPIQDPHLWSTDRAYLYKLYTFVRLEGETIDELTTPYGIRTLSWPVTRGDGDGRFLLNGQPTLINGTCEYEHLLGQGHAFSAEQVASRVKQIKNAGFNAVRDAHQPHRLDYQTAWDQAGILWWPQFSTHIWYDTPAFRENFKALLRQWVKERRNSPSVILWGLQNESTLPRAFAQECCDIIREMDPTATIMRPITTCNGGEGTDWNVVQNWSGTYGGDITLYDQELSRPDQLLNGEYGGMRTVGMHQEPATFENNGAWTEERVCTLLETKVRLAEQVRDKVCGQFQWIFNSHDNPGRRQPDEAYRVVDKIGPINSKGLITPWEQPVDAYYMYRANYVDAHRDPMVYIVSHTWPDRLAEGNHPISVEVYSNCDSVRLYNDAADEQLLGTRTRGPVGTHFTWEGTTLTYNVLRAVGYEGGRPAATDLIILQGLPESPHFESLYEGATDLLQGAEGYTYLYRVNCGGDAYTDTYGQVWAKDDASCSHSWGSDFDGISPFQASQGVTADPIRGTRDWPLLQSFRFGRHRLSYRFPLPDGHYRVELYFTEPWHGTGGGCWTDCEGLRLFDVDINGQTVIDDLDIWAESLHDGALKKVVEVDISGGQLDVDFPEVKAGQAIISGIAIATTDGQAAIPTAGTASTAGAEPSWSWAEANANVLAKVTADMLPEDQPTRAAVTYQAEEAKAKGKFTRQEFKKRTGIFFTEGKKNSLEWTVTTGLGEVYALRFHFMNSSGQPKPVKMTLVDRADNVVQEATLTFPDTPEKWRMMSTTTGGYINAGTYSITLQAEDMSGLAFDALEVQ